MQAQKGSGQPRRPAHLRRTHDPSMHMPCDMLRNQSHVRVRFVFDMHVIASLQGSTSHMFTEKPPW